MSKLKKFVVFLLLLVVIIPCSVFGYFYFKLNSMYESDSKTDEIVKTTNYKEVKGVTNILLVGIDARNLKEASRSDSMMILTIDSNHNSLKLTSLARDTYVDIPGHSKEKLTHAFAYGGINLLLETIENNFKLDINNYVIVNFFSFVEIVDAIGGIPIDIKKSEIKELNTYITNGQKIDKVATDKTVELIKSPGIQTLNGYQSLAYARIRYNDTAFGRDNRQRQIIESTLKKMSAVSPIKYPSILDSILPYVTTNMSPSTILKLGSTVLSLDISTINQLEFPIPYEPYSSGGVLGNKGWVLQFNENMNLPILDDFIFNDIIPDLSNQ